MGSKSNISNYYVCVLVLFPMLVFALEASLFILHELILLLIYSLLFHEWFHEDLYFLHVIILNGLDWVSKEN